jgi:hypothetical protein
VLTHHAKLGYDLHNVVLLFLLPVDDIFRPIVSTLLQRLECSTLWKLVASGEATFGCHGQTAK